jgi:hypothetical protein
MRDAPRLWWQCGIGIVLLCTLSACASKSTMKRPIPPVPEETRVPTVPPSTPNPQPTASPMATRPVPKAVKARKGEAIGPVVTFLGAARADGNAVQPASVDKKGIATYETGVGSGFMLVVEAKAGKSGIEPGRQTFTYVPGDARMRPDLQIETSRDMGNGSPEVCDRRRPNVGGVPGISPPNFAETQRISDALNDFACRFETFVESESSCTLDKGGDYSFIDKTSTIQFCMMVARAYAFPEGDTMLSVRLRDAAGNLGPVTLLRIRRVPMPVKKKK